MTLSVGDPFPGFRAPGNTNPNYAFDSAAGRYLLLAVLGDTDEAAFRNAQSLIHTHRRRFDDLSFSVFGLIAHDAPWRVEATDSVPGVRWLFDPGGLTARLIGEGRSGWVLLDPSLRVLATADLARGPELMSRLATLPPVERHGGDPVHAPVLILPRIFEPALCARLIDHYDRTGGTESGFMREVDGMTRLIHDHDHKRRSDVMLEDQTLIRATQARIARRLAPQIEKAFQFKPTRIERYLVAAYEADGGYFRPHRDNTTKGTAHRRFAVSINLNGDYDGGDLRFPEFGPRTYRPPPGGAAVFSCSLLHEATPVTRGRRYAFLPFLYDEAAAELRQANLGFLAPQADVAPAEAS